MSIQSILKSTVATLAIVASGSLFAQGTPINAAAFDALVAQGPVADAATIASSTWASKIKQAGTLRLGGTQTSNLFSLLNEKDGKARGFGNLFVRDTAAAHLGFGVHSEHHQTDLALAVIGHRFFDGGAAAALEILVGGAVVLLAVAVKRVPATHLGVGVDVDCDEVVKVHGMSPLR